MKVITIGSNPECDVVLNTDGIEPVHCQIIQDDNENYRLVAFGSGIRIEEGNEIVKGKEVSFNLINILRSTRFNSNQIIQLKNYNIDYDNGVFEIYKVVSCNNCNVMPDTIIDEKGRCRGWYCDIHCLQLHYFDENFLKIKNESI